MKTFAKYSILGLAAGLAALTTTTARAERIYAVTDNGSGAGSALVYFDSTTPTLVTTVGSLSGVTNLRAIDFRPSDGLLYGAGYDGTTGTFQLYTISLTTGVATAVGASSVLPGFQNSTRLSIDVNPVANALRVITGNGNSYRFNLGTGALVAQDTTFSGSISGPVFADVAYTNNVAGATTTALYSYDFVTDDIVLVNPPNAGTYTVVGTTGNTSNDAGIGFDISGTSGTAYLSVDPTASAGTVDGLYTLNLATGASTLVGLTGLNLLDISVVPAVPEPGTLALVGIAGAAGAVLARRRLRRRA